MALVLKIPFSRVKWEEARERKHAGLVVLGICFYFCFDFLTSPTGDKPKSSSVFFQFPGGAKRRYLEWCKWTWAATGWRIVASPPYILSFALFFFSAGFFSFFCSSCSHSGRGFEDMFFQASTPKSWELHLMLSCQSTVEPDVSSKAGGSEVRSGWVFWGLGALNLPVLMRAGIAVETARRVINTCSSVWSVKVCRSWELQMEGSRLSQVCGVVLWQLAVFRWAGCLKPPWHPMALGKCGCPSPPAASLVTQMDVLLLQYRINQHSHSCLKVGICKGGEANVCMWGLEIGKGNVKSLKYLGLFTVPFTGLR